MNSFLHHFKTDIPAGIVVFLVALPLCLGIALASGAPFFSGIISGIIGGIIVGTISGSRLSVSGPAAGLAALVLAAIHNIGDFRLFLCAVIIAGILQIFMALARLAGISNYYPSSVIKGMLTSIGILIIAKQIPHALGYARDEQGYLTELLPFHDMHPFFHPIQNIDVGVTLMCFISIAIILVWDRPFIRKKVKYIPGALVAVIFCVLLNEFFYTIGSRFYVESAHLVNLKSANSISEFIGFYNSRF
jgi:MFS superfamily sulfate permease-like transporter